MEGGEAADKGQEKKGFFGTGGCAKTRTSRWANTDAWSESRGRIGGKNDWHGSHFKHNLIAKSQLIKGPNERDSSVPNKGVGFMQEVA